MTAPDPIAAILHQLNERNTREAGTHAEVRSQLVQLDTVVASMTRAPAGDAAASARVDGLAAPVAELTLAAPGTVQESEGFIPAMPRAWWKLASDRRRTPVADLSNWLKHVFKPGDGYLAGALHSCWPSRDMALDALGITSQLWCAFYLQPGRTNSFILAQAEHQTRALAAHTAQIATETGRCTIHPAAGYARRTP